jgi:hypothetical protein
MSDPAAPVGYFVGDEIRIRLSILHDDQITAVDAV